MYGLIHVYGLFSHSPSVQRKHKAQEQDQRQETAGEKLSYHVAPYRRMLPGLKVEQEAKETGEAGKDGAEDEAAGEEEEETIPTPRKRLMNFKIPIINRGGQRRDQNLSVVARRKLFSDEGSVWTSELPSLNQDAQFYNGPLTVCFIYTQRRQESRLLHLGPHDGPPTWG